MSVVPTLHRMWRFVVKTPHRLGVAWFNWIACGILVVTGAVLYGFTLPYPFIFDDHIYLVDNPLIKDLGSFGSLQNFKAFVSAPAKMMLDPDLSVNFILRPVTYLTFYLNYLWDGLRPDGYRAVNVAIHCLNALLLFQLLRLLLRASRKSDGLTPFSTGLIALGAALVFLTHPLQTESVTYIVQRFTSLEQIK